MSILKKIGHILLTIVTFGTIAAEDAAPFISLFNPAWGSLLAAASSAIMNAEAAGTTATEGAPATDTSAQKLALVLAAITPNVETFAKTIGISNPTPAEITTFVNGLVAALDAFQIPTTVTATTPAA